MQTPGVMDMAKDGTLCFTDYQNDGVFGFGFLGVCMVRSLFFVPNYNIKFVGDGQLDMEIPLPFFLGDSK